MIPVIELTLPTSWAELSQKQLRFLLSTIVQTQTRNKNRGFRSLDDYSIQTSAQVATICLLKWCSLKIICRYDDGWLVAHEGEEFKILSSQISAVITHLSFIREIPKEPVRLDKIDGAVAIPADISSDFTFDNWLSCETLWQAYQITSEDAILLQMAEILYRKEGIKASPAELLGVFYWWAAVKYMASDLFPNFFKPSAGGDTPTADSMRRNIDAQIRALTKGDVTKEQEILALPALRALTELDAQAREYEELNKKYPSK